MFRYIRQLCLIVLAIAAATLTCATIDPSSAKAATPTTAHIVATSPSSNVQPLSVFNLNKTIAYSDGLTLKFFMSDKSQPLKVDRALVPAEAADTSYYCWSASGYVEATTFKAIIWRWWVHPYWCNTGSGVMVSFSWPDVGVTITSFGSSLLWSYRWEHSTTTRSTPYQWTGWAEGDMAQCMPILGCHDDMYPNWVVIVKRHGFIQWT